MSFAGEAEMADSKGSVAVYHGTLNSLVSMERRLRVAELVMRILVCVLGVLAASLLGFDSQVKLFFSVEKKATFTGMKSLVFLVVANGIAATYSLMQVMRCVISMTRGSTLFCKSYAWAIFSGDQAVAYLTIAAVAAAAQSSVYGKLGQKELQWIKLCDMYGKFCNQAGEGMASTLVVGLGMTIISSISAYSLFRLYGENKGEGGD
ncbi:hypothetical protein Droror1_Dr00016513 [Drosera rotundifolia]